VNNIVIEPGIEPLVSALGSLDFVKTIYSCEGHFDRPPNSKFLPTAYVTFSTTDMPRFRSLFNRISELNESEISVSLRMTYDCLLGLFTLSIWPDISLEKASHKRVAVDAAIQRLSDAVTNRAMRSASPAMPERATETKTVHPCGENLPPCMLVIPQKELVCPFER
jgi:hypothetical protein